MISVAKLWLFHILTKRFFRCVRPQQGFLDFYQHTNVKMCTLCYKVCTFTLFILSESAFCLSYQPKLG